MAEDGTEQNEVIEEKDGGISNSKKWTYTKINQVEPCQFSEEMYTVSGGFGVNNDYLIPHTREYFFDKRREMAFLRNYYKSIIDATYKQVFAKKIVREYTTNADQYEKFVENCTNGGVHLDDFEQEAIRLSSTMATDFVVMDNFTTENQPEGKEEAIENREFPYVYIRKRTTVCWQLTKIDQFGNIKQIAFAEYKDEKGRTVNRVWDKVKWSDQVIVSATNEDIKVEVIKEDEHGLGEIPVYAVEIGRKADPESIQNGLPPYFDICRVQFAMYQVDSENRDQSRAQRFSILFVQGADVNSMTIGTKVALVVDDVDSSVTPPQFISPDSGLFKEGRDEAKDLEDSLFQMAGQSGVTGTKEAKSGLALQWEFHANERTLQHSSRTAKQLDEWIQYMFGLYIGSEVVGVARFPEEFKPSDIQADLTALETLAAVEGVPLYMSMQYALEFFKKTHKGDDSEAAANIIKKMENDIIDAINAPAIPPLDQDNE